MNKSVLQTAIDFSETRRLTGGELVHFLPIHFLIREFNITIIFFLGRLYFKNVIVHSHRITQTYVISLIHHTQHLHDIWMTIKRMLKVMFSFGKLHKWFVIHSSSFALFHSFFWSLVNISKIPNVKTIQLLIVIHSKMTAKTINWSRCSRNRARLHVICAPVLFLQQRWVHVKTAQDQIVAPSKITAIMRNIFQCWKSSVQWLVICVLEQQPFLLQLQILIAMIMKQSESYFLNFSRQELMFSDVKNGKQEATVQTASIHVLTRSKCVQRHADSVQKEHASIARNKIFHFSFLE